MLAPHASRVQGSPSSQLIGGPDWQLPFTHASLTVHALPSLQALLLLTWVQLPVAVHMSSVQALPSSQMPPATCVQVPVVGSHTSVVHGSPSLQSAAPPHRGTSGTALDAVRLRVPPDTPCPWSGTEASKTTPL